MSRLLETIRIEDGKFSLLAYHQQRMNRSRKALFGCNDEIDLVKILQATFEAENASPQFQASSLEKGLYKCRIIYSDQIEKIEFISYQLPHIWSLKIVIDDQIEYSYKFHDRTCINELFKKREDYDDILIVKNGLVTDTSFANILFFNGKKWLTPAHPLLKGTQRAYLLDKELIEAADIRLEDLKYFEKARLINAMIQFGDNLDISILNIQA